MQYDFLAFYNAFYGIIRATPAGVEGHRVKETPHSPVSTSAGELISFQPTQIGYLLCSQCRGLFERSQSSVGQQIPVSTPKPLKSMGVFIC